MLDICTTLMLQKTGTEYILAFSYGYVLVVLLVNYSMHSNSASLLKVLIVFIVVFSCLFLS